MVTALLAELRKRDVRVWADGDRLRCRAPAGILTPELRNELERRKPEILAFLRSAAALAQQQPAIVPLQPGGTRPPVFAVAGHNGDVFSYRTLVQHLGDDQPFFGLQPPGLDGRSAPLARVEDLAAYFAEQIRAFRPRGPYIITGFCAGGGIAMELARQLLHDGASGGGGGAGGTRGTGGATIEFVGLFGSPYPTWYRFPGQFAWHVAQQRERLRRHVRAVTSLSASEFGHYIAAKLERRRERHAERQAAFVDPVLTRRAAVERITIRALRRYTPRPFAGHVCLFTPARDWLPSAAPQWRALARSAEEWFGPDGCDGDTMLREHAARFAEFFRRCTEARENARPVLTAAR